MNSEINTIPISEFKAHALQILDKVSKDTKPVVITKRGKPLVEVIPYKEDKATPLPGKLASSFLFEDDILSPIGDEIWNVCK